MQILTFTPEDKPEDNLKSKIVNFLHTHLDEFGDPEHEIRECLNYALKEIESFGGYVITATDELGEITGAVILNKTGMKGYIPENILVYIAVHKDYRGKGLGKILMNKALALTSGDVALHVEANNPAKFLYEKVGFSNKYLEMRYKRNQ